MKFKITPQQLQQKLAYFEYVQSCLRGEVIEIPLLFNDWIKIADKLTIDTLTKAYISEG